MFLSYTLLAILILLGLAYSFMKRTTWEQWERFFNNLF